MPITAEQVIRIIDYAIESVRNAEKMRKTLKQIESDAKELLFEQDIREGILDRIAVIRAAAEDAWRYEIDMESLENLFKEKQRFADNAKKNKNAARRMKLMRMVRKEREETGETRQNEQEPLQESPLSPGEVMERIEQGEKRGLEKADNSTPHAARSERIPTADDEDSWKPKEKKGEK